MEDEFDLEELEVVLGLKNKKDELNNIISDKKGLSFLGVISKILNNENSTGLCEKIEPEENQNQMVSNFSHKAGVDKIASVKINEYDNYNFINYLKGSDTLLHQSNINFSDEYVQKLKKDFVKKIEEPHQPIEMKPNKKEYNNKNSNKNQNNKKKDFNKNEKNKTETKENDNIEESDEKNKKEDKLEEEKEQEKEEDNKEKEVNSTEELNEVDNEGNENTYNKNQSNNYHHYNKNYKYKYNKNKGTKAYRQNKNLKKFK